MLCFWSCGNTKSSAGARLIIIIIMLTRQNFDELRMLSSITLMYSRQNAIIIVWRGPFWGMRAGDQKLLFLLEWPYLHQLFIHTHTCNTCRDYWPIWTASLVRKRCSVEGTLLLSFYTLYSYRHICQHRQKCSLGDGNASTRYVWREISRLSLS